MAEKQFRRTRDNVYWSELDRKKTGEEPEMDAYIPGVSDPGNRRPSRVKGRMTREVKAKIPLNQPVVEELLDSSSENREQENREPEKVRKKKMKPGRQSYSCNKKPDKRTIEDTTIMSSSFESLRERSMQQLRQITLKDLRAEDKQRVANLVRELARVGEEKEKAISDLHGEREHYETQVLTLVQQQEKILREREDVQEKLFLCQKLLTEYQAQLLNKEEKINAEMRQGPEAGENPTNRRSAIRSANQKLPQPELTNQNDDDQDSVTDLLLANKDPAESIKRPYSSMIDKEIARERSLSRSSRGSVASRSRSVSPLDGRPRFSYPPKLNGIGPLPEPVASSTHKSMDINAQMSHNQDLDSPRSSIRGSSVRIQSQSDEKHKRKIVFNDDNEQQDVKKYSPNMKGKEMFNDPEYANYYKKLSPSGRKRELLRQRQALLDEQDRLKQVLTNQERQLKVRQYEYQKREELQKQRMEFYKEGGKFPALKLDFETGSVQGTGSEQEDSGKERYNREVGQVMTDRFEDLERIEIGSRSRSPPKNEVEIDDEIQIRSRVSAGTSPIASPRSHTVSIATSDAKGQGHQRELIYDEDLPRLIDVATSISYRSPLQDTSNRQGNLPLCTNRQKLSPMAKLGTNPTTRTEEPASARVPGDKTLNVLDIVNSMEEQPNNEENQPMTFTPNKYLIQQKGNQRSPYRVYTSPAQSGTTRRKNPDDMEESVEENRILEDIFFL